MKKLLIYLFLLLPISVFGQLPLINIGTSANDHTGDPLRTMAQKTNNVISAVNNNVEASTVLVLKADSVSGAYATKKYVADHMGHVSTGTSLPTSATTGDLFLNTSNNKLYWLSGGYWHWNKTASIDSVAVSGGSSYGSELIANGTFDSNATSWPVSGTGWAWQTDGAGGGWLRHSVSAEDELLYQDILTIGTIYHITITVGGSTTGYVNLTCGHDYGYTVVITDNGTYTYDLQCIGDDGYFRVEATSGFNGYVDSISVKEVL